MCAPPAFYGVPHHSVWHRHTKLKVAACIYVCGVRFYVRRDGLLLNFKILGEIGVAVRFAVSEQTIDANYNVFHFVQTELSFQRLIGFVKMLFC
jgi:hypothetical protein